MRFLGIQYRVAVQIIVQLGHQLGDRAHLDAEELSVRGAHGAEAPLVL